MNLVELHQLGLDILERLDLIPDEVAVRVRQHPHKDAVELKAFGPLLADGRWQLGLQVLQLVKQMVDLLVNHVLLLRSAVLQLVGF